MDVVPNPRTADSRTGGRSPFPARAAAVGCVIVLLAILLPGPVGAQTVLAPETALVRIAHASPDAPAIDVYLDDQLVTGAAAFGSVSPYVPVATGDHDLQIVPAGGDPARQVLATTSVTFDRETLQLVAIQDYLSSIALSVYPEDVSAIESQGYARIRLIHLVPDGEEISLLTADGNELFDSAMPLTASRYEDIQAGGHDLTLQAERQETVPAIPVPLALLPNVAYDLVVIGQVKDQSLRVLPLVTATDQPCGQFLGIGGPNSGCLRFMNASPEIPAVDLYIGDDPVPAASNLGFGVVTPVISVPSGDLDIQIVATGTAREDALADKSLFVDEGAGFLLIGSGPVDHARLNSYEDLNASLGGQQTRLSVIHRAGDAGTVDVNANGQPLVRGIIESEQSDDRLLPAGSYVFQVTANPDGTVLGQSEAVTLGPGTTTQIVLVGDTDDGVVAIVVASLPVPIDTSVPAP